MLLVLFTVQLY